MRLKNKKILVYGLGDSGRAVIKILQEKNAHVSFYDEDIRFFDQIGFERNPRDKDWDFVVISPGVKCRDNPLLKHFEERKIPVISELDFAYLLSRGKIVAVTGTNGKTTVCMLVNKILKSAGYKTFLCGNIGLPFSAICEKTDKNSVVVCEVSSFQLETSKYFRADVACVLNIQPDHLDRHGSFEEYVSVKGKISTHMQRKDLLILNLDDENARKLGHRNSLYFSKNKMKKGVYIWKNQIYAGKRKIVSVSDISLLGEKNLENVLASVAICSQFKVSQSAYFEAIKNFLPASHRMEKVGTVDGVVYIDDSKATNVASTVACVESFKDKNFFLLLGGQGKNLSFDELFCRKFAIKKVVCFGQDGNNIALSAKKFGYSYEIFDKFFDAVHFCIKTAERGDYVLLSPGCASFDEFSSYAERGECFKNIILGNFNENQVVEFDEN